MKTPTGAQFVISIDGKPRSYRDTKAMVIEAAEYLKSRHPHSEVTVKNLGAGNQRWHGEAPELQRAVRDRAPRVNCEGTSASRWR